MNNQTNGFYLPSLQHLKQGSKLPTGGNAEHIHEGENSFAASSAEKEVEEVHTEVSVINSTNGFTPNINKNLPILRTETSVPRVSEQTMPHAQQYFPNQELSMHPISISQMMHPSLMPQQYRYGTPNFNHQNYYYPPQMHDPRLHPGIFPNQQSPKMNGPHIAPYLGGPQIGYELHPTNNYYLGQQPLYTQQPHLNQGSIINVLENQAIAKTGLEHYDNQRQNQIENQFQGQVNTNLASHAPYALHFPENTSARQPVESKSSRKRKKEEPKLLKKKKKHATHYKMKPKTFSDQNNKIDTDKTTNLVDRVKKALLKNKQGRPITLDLSVNVTLYENLEDYMLHFLRKNHNLDYWFSQDNEDPLQSSWNKDKEDSLTKKLREDANIDNLKYGDSVDISSLGVLKYFYLQGSKLQDLNLKFNLPLTQTKVLFDPRLEQFPCFPKVIDREGRLNINVFKEFKIQNQAQISKNLSKGQENGNSAFDSNNPNISIVKKVQILHTMGSSEESILTKIKSKLGIAPTEKVAILKQYKRSMFPPDKDNQLGNGSESKIVMFDYLPIVNEDEINIEFFKKIICFPKYRTNYDLVLIKLGNNTSSKNFSNQIRCYFDKSLYNKVVNEYRNVHDELYKYYVLKDINTALVGTMISNYSGLLNFHQRESDESKKEGSEGPENPVHKNHVDFNLKGEFVTLPNGLEVFEEQPRAVWQKQKTRYMCYDTWVLDIA